MTDGAILGPYELLREIGNGGQGRVLLGFDPRLRRRVAIKLYRDVATRETLRRFRDEARRLARVNSSRVVPVYDLLRLPGSLALVTAYVRGCDLRSALRSGRLSIDSTLSLSRDITAAIAAARRAGVVHGDISASNVLISEEGRALLGDFGAAALLGQASHAFSPAAAAPEHLQGAALDLRTDIFALGLLMYSMLAGFHPFLRGGVLDEGALLRGEFPGLGTVPGPRVLVSRLDRLVRRLLAPDPDQRPASTQEVRGELRAIYRGVPQALAGTVRQELRGRFRRESELPPVASIPDAARAVQALPMAKGSARIPPRLHALLASLLAFVLLFAVRLWEPRLPWVVALPELHTVTGPGVSARELQHRFQQALQRLADRQVLLAQERPVRLYMVGDRVERIAGPGREVSLRLRCERTLCLLQAHAEGQEPGVAAQRLLFADTPRPDWDAALAALAGAVAASEVR